MAVSVNVSVQCDMCGRSDELPYREKWRWGVISLDLPSVVPLFTGWELMRRDGYPVKDPRCGDGRVLCPECAKVYREAVEESNKGLDALLGGSRA